MTTSLVQHRIEKYVCAGTEVKAITMHGIQIEADEKNVTVLILIDV